MPVSISGSGRSPVLSASSVVLHSLSTQVKYGPVLPSRQSSGFPHVGHGSPVGLQVTTIWLFSPRLAIVLHPVPSGLYWVQLRNVPHLLDRATMGNLQVGHWTLSALKSCSPSRGLL